MGFYLNLDILFEIMKARGLFSIRDNDFKVYLCSESENQEMMTLQLAQELHSNGIKTIISPEIRFIEAEIKQAKSNRCSLMLIIRDDNLRDGKILLRNLVKEHQDYVSLKDTLPAILLARKALKQE